jgi:hypothetical protein
MKVDKNYENVLESYPDRIVEETVYLSEEDLAKLIEEKINRAKIYHEAYIKNFDKVA